MACIMDKAGNVLVENNALSVSLTFPLEFACVNNWMYNYIIFANSSDALCEPLITLMRDIRTFYLDATTECKDLLLSGIKGIWNLFVSFANVQNPQIIDLIVKSLNDIFSSVTEFSKIDIVNINDKRKGKRFFTNEVESLDGFKKPMKSAKVIVATNDAPISTKNTFENLAEMADVENDNEVGQNSASNAQSQRKDPRPEPIHLRITSNWREISAKVNDLCKSEIVKIFQGECIKFVPKTVDHYRIIQKYFSEQKYEFFGLKLKNERPRKVLLKGIPIDVKINEIKDELVSQNFSIHRVAQLSDFKTKRPLPIFMVDIFPDDQFKHIFDIQAVLGFKVKVEIYKFKGTRQCYNCQRFNHSSDVCGFNPVCVKCAGSHRASECKVTDRKEIKCANCSANHTANFGGCPKNPKNMQRSKITTIRDSNKSFTASKVQKNISFANLVKGNTLPPVDNSKTHMPKIVNLEYANTNTSPVPASTSKSSNIKNSNTDAQSAHDCISQNLSATNLIEYILTNNIDIDSLITKLNNLYNILNKFTALLQNQNANSLLNIFGNESLSKLSSSASNTK